MATPTRDFRGPKRLLASSHTAADQGFATQVQITLQCKVITAKTLPTHARIISESPKLAPFEGAASSELLVQPDAPLTAKQAAEFWRELERAVSLVHVVRQPPAWRRRRTGEMRLTLTERRAMQAFHLLEGESYTALSRRFRRDRHYMARWIWTPEYRAFFNHYWRTDGPPNVARRGRKAVAENVSRAAA